MFMSASGMKRNEQHVRQTERGCQRNLNPVQGGAREYMVQQHLLVTHISGAEEDCCSLHRKEKDVEDTPSRRKFWHFYHTNQRLIAGSHKRERGMQLLCEIIIIGNVCGNVEKKQSQFLLTVHAIISATFVPYMFMSASGMKRNEQHVRQTERGCQRNLNPVQGGAREYMVQQHLLVTHISGAEEDCCSLHRKDSAAQQQQVPQDCSTIFTLVLVCGDAASWSVEYLKPVNEPPACSINSFCTKRELQENKSH
ncbi:Hypothetical protein, putative [Bodo saltans]|uniref:Uncharacterized protein n=1 Tax=Bodo saltans TaxID=75058 RepID=A0A0S4IKS4_BODSA|nr:Hypothetical protein, putative [Bodo saltans]|eukprot:CUE68489.1 Hypothetical protein, putative [Bodo saltans]